MIYGFKKLLFLGIFYVKFFYFKRIYRLKKNRLPFNVVTKKSLNLPFMA